MFNLKTIFTALIIIVSLIILVCKPKMPKQAVITDSEYRFVEIEVPNTASDLSSQNITLSDNNIEVKNNSQPHNIKYSNVNGDTKKIKTTTPLTTKQNDKKVVPKNPSQNNQKQTAKPIAPKTESKQQQPKTEMPKTVDVKPTQNIENRNPKQFLTEEEEIIAWNHWRSRLQNQVMMDSKVMAPLGTVFKFSFTVDKYGNMSNVKVWSTNPMYSDYAVRMIKPVLMSYRNKPILNFPARTRRIITNVDGGFTMARRTQYSSPSDYHDYETIRK